MTNQSNITELIQAVALSQDGAKQELLDRVYAELHRLASIRMSQENRQHTLQTTALVNEAYLRLFETTSAVNWQNRTHFFRAAAEAMRRILVEHARHKKNAKRGGQATTISITQDITDQEVNIDEVLDIDAALKEFAVEHQQKAELVKLRYFAGMTIQEAAKVLDISIATANRHWAFAQAWLLRKIGEGSR